MQRTATKLQPAKTSQSHQAAGFKAFWRQQVVQPLQRSALLRWFLGIGTVFGLLLVFLVPPLSGFDSLSHFNTIVYYAEPDRQALVSAEDRIKMVTIDAETARAIAESGGILQRQEPVSGVYDVLWSADGHTADRAPVDLGASAVYSAPAYTPQIAAVYAARLLHLPLLVQLWLACIAGLAAYLLLSFLALRILPFGKWALFIVALLPMGLFQAATLSADGLLNGLVFLFVAIVFRLAFGEGSAQKYRTPLLSLLVLTGLGIALSKPSYVVLALLPVLIPAVRFGRQRLKWLFAGALAGLMAVVALLWNLHVKDHAITMGELYRAGFNISYDEQLAHIIAQPVAFLGVIARTAFYNGADYIGQLVGVFSPQFDLLPLPILVLLLAGFVVAAWTDGRMFAKVQLWQRLVIAAVIAGILAVICVTFYLTYTPLYKPTIDGIQGRYFLPLLVLLLPLISWQRIAVRLPRQELVFAGIAVVGLVAASIRITSLYWA